MKAKEINKCLARHSMIVFGTMWMFYVFFVYGLLPLVPQLQPYQNQLMYWSTWVQLWALPLLMVGQNVIGESAEKRDQETHDMVVNEFDMIKKALHIATEERVIIRMALHLATEEREQIKEALIIANEERDELRELLGKIINNDTVDSN